MTNVFRQGDHICASYDACPAHLIEHVLATPSFAVLAGHHKSNPFYQTRAIAIERTAHPADAGWKLSQFRQR